MTSRIAWSTSAISFGPSCRNGPSTKRLLSIARSWSIIASESRCKSSPWLTRTRRGSASTRSPVVSGTINVEGWPSSSRACACTTRTGRTLPGSVPRRGFNLASQISPRLRIWILFKLSELRVDAHALSPHLAGCGGQLFCSETALGFPVEVLNSPPNVGRSSQF